MERMLALSALLGIASSLLLNSASAASSGAQLPLVVEAKISLGDIAGRIDHLAFDPTRQRLYVAELGNDSIGIVDLRENRLLRTVPGFREPQGIAYESSTDSIYVANGGDGTVRVFRAADFSSAATIRVGADPDNVRVDLAATRVYVGYGAGPGGLAVIDPAARKKIADIPLKQHPESFQLEPGGPRIFVNVPEADEIAVVSGASRSTIAEWPTGALHGNFPLALDTANRRALAVFRHPPRLAAYDTETGNVVATSNVCSDADDAFVDVKRSRLFVLCGEGFVEAIDSSSDKYPRVGRFTTSPGSRTGLFIPDRDRLVVAIRASGKSDAALWVLK